jgi:aspartyl-tRNA(Asn)/glutamyl-tRNA(Gln) amidotransferase subunit C
MAEDAFNTTRGPFGATQPRIPGEFEEASVLCYLHPMKITPEQVRHVAALARLELSPQEEERIAGELEAILGYVDKLNELDVTNVAPTSHVFDVGAAFREDVVRNEPAVDELLENAPERWQGFFRVPKIIE